ncbi:translation initiation factor IF-2 N-terminal domain-containing protein, partial [Rhodococcus sp. BP-110]
MAGKARVHELAKELGVTSKDLLARLKEQGEFVKSASSTVEAPVARRLRESYPSASGDAAPSTGARPSGNGAGPKPGGPRPGPKPAPAAPEAPAAAAPEAPAAQAPAPSAPAAPAPTP